MHAGQTPLLLALPAPLVTMSGSMTRPWACSLMACSMLSMQLVACAEHGLAPALTLHGVCCVGG